jgi:5-hydroxyisourate hydrolase-like protein (transthyretin family)
MRKILLLTLLIAVVGCSPSNRPKDLPTLYPCTVVITQDGKPLAEATVEFTPVDSANAKYRAASVTDANGTVSMTTYGFAGVPAGKYKVVVSKVLLDNLEYADNKSTGQKEVVNFNKYKVVDSKYSSAETTPHEIEITNKKKNETYSFDVGKTIKEMIP